MPPISRSLESQTLSSSGLPVATPALSGSSYVSTGESLRCTSSSVLMPLESAKFTRLLESNFLTFSRKIPFGVSSTFRQLAASFSLVVGPSTVVSSLSLLLRFESDDDDESSDGLDGGRSGSDFTFDSCEIGSDRVRTQ